MIALFGFADSEIDTWDWHVHVQLPFKHLLPIESVKEFELVREHVFFLYADCVLDLGLIVDLLGLGDVHVDLIFVFAGVAGLLFSQIVWIKNPLVVEQFQCLLLVELL